MCQITAPLQLLASKNIRMQIGRIVYPCSPFFLSCRRHTKNQTAAHQQQRRRKPQSQKSTFLVSRASIWNFNFKPTTTHTQPDQNGTPDATQQPNGHSPVPGTQHTGELAGGGWWAYLIDDVVPHESAGHEALVFIQQASYS